jgi:FK506-binding nuclear protein
MAQQPIGLFGLKVLPGEETQLDSMEDIRITNISFGEIVNGTGRTVVRVHHKPVPAFDEDSDDEDDFDDFSEEDEEEEDEEEDDEDVDAKVNGAKAAIEDLEGDEEDDDDDEEEDEEEEEETFILCSLYPGKQEQVTVDLHFSVDDDVRFSISGDNAVEIMGNYLSPGRFDDDPDLDEVIDSEDDEEIDSDELEMLEGDSEDDEEEIDGDDIELELLDSDEEEDDEDDMEEDDRLEVVEEDIPKKSTSKTNGKKRTAEQAEVSMDEDVSAPVTDAELTAIAKEMGLDVSKLTKNQRKKLNKRLRSDDSAAETSSASIAQEQAAIVTKEAGKPAKVAAKETVKKDGKPTTKKVTLPSGVIIEDVKIGSGPQAKAGNRLGMRYVGRLQNGKQFDANTKGKPFTFKLGKGEVIGGWDQGLRGMQVGGERRLVIPPKQAYGARGAPPDIPGNATLVFDVKLVEIK